MFTFMAITSRWTIEITKFLGLRWGIEGSDSIDSCLVSFRGQFASDGRDGVVMLNRKWGVPSQGNLTLILHCLGSPQVFSME